MAKKIKSDDSLKRVSDSGIMTRSFKVGFETLKEDDRSITAVLSTETPVRVYDWESGQYIEEILLSDGFEFPEQVPLLDSHSRYSVKDQLGSIREMTVSDLQLLGRVYFGNVQDALNAFEMVKDRHLTDLSIGYVTAETVILKDGQEYTHKDGRKFVGPKKLSIRTVVKEGSVTPIGADEMAKFRTPQKPVEELERLSALENENRELKEKLSSVNKSIYLLSSI